MVHSKSTAVEKTREPVKHQYKGGGFEKSEVQKKHLLDKAQRTNLELICVGKE